MNKFYETIPIITKKRAPEMDTFGTKPNYILML